MGRRFVRFLRGLITTGLAVSLLACGGGGGGEGAEPGGAPAGVPAAPVRNASLEVLVTDQDGRPISGARVSVSAASDLRVEHTNAAGRVVFNLLPAAEADFYASSAGYFRPQQGLAPVMLTSNSRTSVAVTLVSATKAVPVVLGARGWPSNDGTKLIVDLDLAILDEHGRSIETLTAADFRRLNEDCDLNFAEDCPTTARTRPSGPIFVPTGGEQSPTGFSLVAARNRPPVAVALLLPRDRILDEFDPTDLRLEATASYLRSVSAPDLVTLSSNRTVPDQPVLTTYGGFTSDGRSFLDGLDQLKRGPVGSSSVLAAVQDMIGFIASNPPAGPQAPKPMLVAMGSGPSECSEYCESLDTATDAALQRGIPVSAVGWSGPVAELAIRSGGVFVLVTDPIQHAVAAGGLAAIVSRSIPFNRLRFEMEMSSAGMPPEWTAFMHVEVRVSPQIRLYVLVPVPVA